VYIMCDKIRTFILETPCLVLSRARRACLPKRSPPTYPRVSLLFIYLTFNFFFLIPSNSIFYFIIINKS
jgi:hypothetical protein